jgi:imidazolonepropionase-like amidohydrolase
MPGARAYLSAALALLLAGCALGLQDAVPEADLARALQDTEPALLLRGASVMSAAGPTIAAADVLVRDGKIAAIGRTLEAPPGAQVVELQGLWITPGLIDPHSHIGVYPLPRAKAHSDGNETSGPFHPEIRVEDGLWPQDPAIRRAVAGGVTTVHVLPGSGNLVGGEGQTLRLRPARSAREMRFEGAPRTMKMACGENPKRVYGRKGAAPITRMGEAAMLRQQLERARAYRAKRSKGTSEDEAETKPATEAKDFATEALAGVLSGEILIQNHCHRADDMLVWLDLFDEFGVRPRAFHHATEGYKITDRLREAGVGAVVFSDWYGGSISKMEMFDMVGANAALLDENGVRVALHSDSTGDAQRLNQEAAKALAAGRRVGIDVNRDRAIRWVTANAAWVLGIEDRVGTIETGKVADLVVWSGDPFSVYSKAEKVFIEGELVYDRANPALYPISDFELGLGAQP